MESQTGAAYGEQNPERLAQRNGYRDRTWETRACTVELRIPRLRKLSLNGGLGIVVRNGHFECLIVLGILQCSDHGFCRQAVSDAF